MSSEKDSHAYPDPYSLEVLRSKQPPLWDTTRFPMTKYESHVQLVPYIKYLDCPTGDGGHLRFMERTGTMRRPDGKQLACIHKCTKCARHWAIADAQYPYEKLYFADMTPRMRDPNDDRS
jgi:hypothetical protein